MLAGCAHEGTALSARVVPPTSAARAVAPGAAQHGVPIGAPAGVLTMAAISAEDLRTRVYIFADDSMQGRAAGSPGHERALTYIVHELTRLGLRPPANASSYLQRVPLPGGGRDTVWSNNVIAVIPGSDSALSMQYVALGAHSDHLGMRHTPVNHDSVRAVNRALWEKRGRVAGAPSVSASDRAAIMTRVNASVQTRRVAGLVRLDSIYNGADDDGSGSMALLELAEYFAAQPVALRRSLLFVWHTAEEVGLNGSDWFVTHPVVPLRQIVTQINIDMLGRGTARDVAGGGNDYLDVIGAGRLSSDLAAWVREVNATEPKPLALDYSLDADGHPENIYCRSDHALYASRGIPIVFFFTNIHEDYHEVTDEPPYLDYPHFARITSYIGDLVRSIANRATAPVVDKPRPDPRARCRQ